MADQISLKDALGSFFGGLQQAGISQAIADAQTKVSELKSAGLSASEERRQMGALAQDLVMNVGRLGGTAADMNELRLSLKPAQPQSVQEYYAQALASGSELDQKRAKEAMQFESKLKAEQMREGRQKSLAEIELMQNKFNDKKNEAFLKAATPVLNKVDPLLQSGRTVLGQLQNREIGIKEAQALLSKPNITPIEQQEAAVSLARVMLGGVPGESTIKSLSPETLNKVVAEAKQFVTGAPAYLNTPKFTELYNSMIDRVKNTTHDILKKSVTKTLFERVDLARRDPEKYRGLVAQKTGYDVEDIGYSEKTGTLYLKKGAKQKFDPFADATSTETILAEPGLAATATPTAEPTISPFFIKR